MSAAVATLEKVRQVYLDLLDRGEGGSAARVLELIGGSKTTVLKHLTVVRKEVAAGPRETDPAIGHLQGAADLLVQKLWTAAQQQAASRHEREIRALRRVLQDLSEDLETSRLAEEEALARAETAERKLASYEQGSVLESEIEARIRSLIALVQVNSLEPEPEPEPEEDHGMADDEERPSSPLFAILELLESREAGMLKDDVYRLATEAGHPAAAVHKDRWRSVKCGYVQLVDEPVLHLTKVGRDKLTAMRARGTSPRI